jgi:hypothetical protein
MAEREGEGPQNPVHNDIRELPKQRRLGTFKLSPRLYQVTVPVPVIFQGMEVRFERRQSDELWLSQPGLLPQPKTKIPSQI